MTKFLELVTERPDPSLGKLLLPACAFCGSLDIRSSGTATTLVGGGAANNHTWTNCTCNECGETFTVESKGGNTWYTKDQKVLKGIPSCFEHYIYTCTHCGGDVERKYTQLDGETSASGLLISTFDGNPVKHYRIFFECKSCGANVESEDEYYRPARHE